MAISAMLMLCYLSVGFASRSEADNATDKSYSTACRDTCMKCNEAEDGFNDFIQFDRSRQWAKFIANLATGGFVGALGAHAVAAGAIAAAALPLLPVSIVSSFGALVADGQPKANKWNKFQRTSGLFCERMDTVKITRPIKDDGSLSCSKAKLSWLTIATTQKTFVGRTQRNWLKPYTNMSQKKAKEVNEGFERADFNAYMNGCKVLMASGLNAFKQLSSKKVEEAFFLCAKHSKLCGSQGASMVPMEHCCSAAEVKHTDAKVDGGALTDVVKKDQKIERERD